MVNQQRVVGWCRAGRVIVPVVVSAFLGACGGGGDSAPTSTTPVDSTTPVAPSPSPTAVSTALTLDLAAPGNYAAPAYPAHYDATVLAADNTPRADPVTDRVAAVGRVLFYDKSLSLNDTIACASCHRQALGFGDSARFSTGFAGGQTTATSMRLGNLRFYRPGTAFWDKRAATVEAQAVQPIQHPVEMGFDAAHGGIAAVLAKLQAKPLYTELFVWAFGDATVTEPRVQRALAQFERAMVSTASRWDTAYAAVYDATLADKGLSLPVAGFTAQEERGRVLFIRAPADGGLGCASCHQAPTFALGPAAGGNGLDAGEAVVFKSPSLKNVSRSGAFMHDGRFATLDQVVEHYNSGVQLGPALDARLIAPNGQPRRLNLSVADKAAVVAFLRTLDDSSLVGDARFSDPFRR